MRKLLALCAVVIFVTSGVSAQADKTSAREQGNAKQSQPAAVLGNSHDVKLGGKTDQLTSNPDPSKWYAPIEKPEWWLVALGFLTIGFIGWQAWETRKAATATQMSAEATLKSVELQESQLRQWVDIADWEVKSTHDANRIAIRCYVVNPTAMPITIIDIKNDGHFAMPSYPEGTRLAVSPKGRCLFQLPMMGLSAREIKDFDEDRLTFPIMLTVTFKDAFERILSTRLSFQCTCGRGRHCEIEQLLLWSTHPSETQTIKSQK